MNSQAYRITGSTHGFRDGLVVALTMLSLTGFSVSVAKVGQAHEEASDRASLYGAAQPLGNGTMRTYVEVVDGVPIEVGVALSEDALEGLPHGHEPGAIVFEGHHVMFEYVLDLPANNPTPFQHVALNWNVSGHEPVNIYDKPHFDFHFNLISDEYRRTITHEDPAFDAKAARYPAETHTPAGWVALPGGVPQMGAHWINPVTPELNGETFTQTFIFGTWDGELIFAEPMITKAFLESKPDFSAQIPVPAQVRTPGYYPSSYGIRWDEDAREYRVSLERLVAR